jgi:hypothetical protein
MQPVLAAIHFTTGLVVVIWIGFLLSLAYAKIQFRVMKERELQQRLDQAQAEAEMQTQEPAQVESVSQEA